MTGVNRVLVLETVNHLLRVRGEIDTAVAALQALLGDPTPVRLVVDDTGLAEAELHAFLRANPNLVIDPVREPAGERRQAATPTAPPVAPAPDTDLNQSGPTAVQDPPPPVVDDPAPDAPDDEPSGATSPAALEHRAADRAVILAALRPAPLSPGALRAACDFGVRRFRGALDELLAEGRVLATGMTRQRTYELAQGDSAGEGAGTPASPSVAPSLVADELITATLRESGPLTFDELVAAVPEQIYGDPVQATKRALRRLTLRGKVMDLGTKWRAA